MSTQDTQAATPAPGSLEEQLGKARAEAKMYREFWEGDREARHKLSGELKRAMAQIEALTDALLRAQGDEV